MRIHVLPHAVCSPVYVFWLELVCCVTLSRTISCALSCRCFAWVVALVAAWERTAVRLTFASHFDSRHARSLVFGSHITQFLPSRTLRLLLFSFMVLFYYYSFGEEVQFLDWFPLCVSIHRDVLYNTAAHVTHYVTYR